MYLRRARRLFLDCNAYAVASMKASWGKADLDLTKLDLLTKLALHCLFMHSDVACLMGTSQCCMTGLLHGLLLLCSGQPKKRIHSDLRLLPVVRYSPFFSFSAMLPKSMGFWMTLLYPGTSSSPTGALKRAATFSFRVPLTAF